MDTAEWLVVGTGLAAIGWINWWFLLAPRSTFELGRGMRMRRGRLAVEAAAGER